MEIIKVLLLCGRSFIFAFISINFFNLLPIKIFNPKWANSVNMLLVDSGSLLVIGFILIRLGYYLSLESQYKFDSFSSTNDLNENQGNINGSNKVDNYLKKINLLNKSVRVFMVIFLTIIFTQIIIFFNALTTINYENQNKFEIISKRIDLISKSNKYNSEKSLEKFNENDNPISKKIQVSPKIQELEELKERSLRDLNEEVWNARFNISLDTLRIILLSILWALCLYSLTRY